METMEMTTNHDGFWRAFGPRKRKHRKKNKALRMEGSRQQVSGNRAWVCFVVLEFWGKGEEQVKVMTRNDGGHSAISASASCSLGDIEAFDIHYRASGHFNNCRFSMLTTI